MTQTASPLSISGLTKRFGPLVAVDSLDLSIQQGEVFGLLGPNGAGKTTVIRMLCGFLAPDAGEIRFDGNPVHGLRHMVGICPQEIVIWEQLTCLEQLVFVASMYGVPAGRAHERALELLDALNLREKTHTRAKALSGGMKRRLNLLLALMHDPPIVLLDEPEAGLDPQSRVLVREFVKGLARRKTVIMTSHNMDEVDRVADRIGIMHKGKLLLVDTPQTLKASVGAGDALRIEAEGCDEAAIERALAALRSLRPNLSVAYAAGAFTVRSLHVVDVVADAVGALKGLGVTIRSMAIRENTLEDVFITLTGRSLSHESL